jgi:hypothetical protein
LGEVAGYDYAAVYLAVLNPRFKIIQACCVGKLKHMRLSVDGLQGGQEELAWLRYTIEARVPIDYADGHVAYGAVAGWVDEANHRHHEQRHNYEQHKSQTVPEQFHQVFPGDAH